MQERPNVLFIVIDQLRADCLHGALAEHVDTPALDTLMSDAVTFRNNYSVTNPCGPSRMSMLTGQYAMNHRAVRNGTPLPHDKPNIAREARKSGYLPLLFGYTDATPDPRVHDPRDPDVSSYEQVLPGFEQALEMRLEESWPWRAHLLARGYDVPAYPEIFRPQGEDICDPALYAAEDSDTAFLTDRVLDGLRGRPQGWFAHVTYIRPHPPLVAPAPYNTLIDPTSLPAPAPVPETEHVFDALVRQSKPALSNVEGIEGQDTAETTAKLRAVYLGLLAEVDHHIGRLITFLKESGQYDDTLIVVTADHGEMLGDFGQWGKFAHHDAAYHTPLILRDPAHPSQHGQTIDAWTESVDLSPTLLDWMGAEIPHSMDGRSLMPFLRGEDPADWRSYSYSELDFGDPLVPTLWQREQGLECDSANLAILRQGSKRLVHFADGFDTLLHCVNSDEQSADVNEFLSMTQALLSHRMRNSEGQFSRTLIADGGVQTAA